MLVIFDPFPLSQTVTNLGPPQRRHLRGAGGPSPLPRKKIKEEKKGKKEKREKERKNGTTNDVKLLHIKCCFPHFFNSPVVLKNRKKIAHQEKVEMTPLTQ